MNSYDAGTLVLISAAFTVGGVATDPTVTTCAVQKPDGTTLTPTPVRDGAGAFHANVDTTGGPGGVWGYRWTGTGADQAVSDGQFYVKAVGF